MEMQKNWGLGGWMEDHIFNLIVVAVRARGICACVCV